MKIEFYQLLSPRNSFERKTSNNPEDKAEFDFFVKENMDLVNPVIYIDSGKSMFVSFGIFVNINWAYIPYFKRWYFITGVSIISNDVIEIRLHCDVLYTYKEGLLNAGNANFAYVVRNEFGYNKLLYDPEIPRENDMSSIAIYSNEPFIEDDPSIILVTAGP